MFPPGDATDLLSFCPPFGRTQIGAGIMSDDIIPCKLHLMEDTFYNKIPDRKFSHEVVFAGFIEKNSENFYMIQILTMISKT